MIYMVNNKHNLDKVRLLKAYVARDGLRKYRNHQFRCHRISSYLFIHRTFFIFFIFLFSFFTDTTDNTEQLHNKTKYTGKL
jgi:hypothetical protein